MAHQPFLSSKRQDYVSRKIQYLVKIKRYLRIEILANKNKVILYCEILRYISKQCINGIEKKENKRFPLRQT